LVRARVGFLLLPLALGLAFLSAPATALATPGDPFVVAEDALAAPGSFFSAVHRISLASGLPAQLTAANALPNATALAFTGPDTLVTVGFHSIAHLNLTSGQLVNVAANAAGDLKGVALAPDGSIIATTTDGGPSNSPAVLRIDPSDGSSVTIASGENLINPLGVTVAESGKIYVTNSDGAGHGQVIRIDPTNGAQSVVASTPLVAPWGIAFLPSGELVVADASYNGAFRGALVRIDPETTIQTPLFLEHLNGPIENATGVAVDANGKVLVTERNSSQVDRVDLGTGVAQLVGQGAVGPLDVEPEPGVAPTTTLISGPSGTSRNTTPTFTFAPSQYGAQSSCLMDRGPAVPCQRSFTSPPLANGPHSFQVRSSVLGAQGPAMLRNFTIDPNASDTLIDSGPSGPTNDPTPTFSFEAPGGGTTFTCSFDGGPIAPCETPFTAAAPLADGPHSFNVRANGDLVGDTRDFTVDTAAPETTISSGPGEGVATKSTQPTFTFSSSEEPSTFTCTLDGAPVLCGSVFTPATPLAEGLHTLTVAATDAAGNPDPSPLARHFSVDTTPPETTITGGPSGTTDEAAPTFTFTASEAGVTFHCSIDSLTLTLCASPFTVAPALADGAHTFRVQATDAAGNVEATVRQRDFTVDAAAPDTSITAGPSGLTKDATPSFEFQSTKPGSTFACALDGNAAVACVSPFQTAALADGAHTFTVTATDALDHPDPTPATRSFTLDTTAPQTTLGAGPGPLTDDRTPEFHFTSEPGATFSCKIDGGAAAPCVSPFTAPPLGEGAHTVVVTATDLAGNVELAPPAFDFSVDTIAPETTITGGPTGTTGDAAPTFTFTGSEAGVTFRCGVDGASLTVCTSPFTIAPTADGAHTFRVQATDAAGNVETTVRQRTFTVDTTAPETTVDTGPEDSTTDRRPTFAFHASEAATFRCSLDGGAPIDCDRSFQPAAALSLGAHTFTVTATDAVGNADPTPPQRHFTVIEEGSDEPRLPPPLPPGTPKPAEPEPHSAHLSLSDSLHHGVLQVRISASPGATGSISLTVTGRLGRRKLARHLSLGLRGGVATGTLHLPAGATQLRLLARYAGDDAFAPATASATVRRRP
jgi:hypothetical protein